MTIEQEIAIANHKQNTLNEDERELVQWYRSLSDKQRNQMRRPRIKRVFANILDAVRENETQSDA